MIEKTILDYLNSELTIPVYCEIPKTKPEKYYAIERTGGSFENKICRSNIVIQSYAKTMFDAVSMNEAIKAKMLDGLVTLDRISKVELNSDYNYTDPTTAQYRYQAVFVVTHY